MLPKDALPVTHWSRSDDAFHNIVLGIEQVIEKILSSRKPKESSQTGIAGNNRLTATFVSSEPSDIISHSPLEEAAKTTLQSKELRPPNKLPKTWYTDPKYSSGRLSIFVFESKEK